DDQEGAERKKVRLSSSGRAGNADVTINVQTGTQNRRVADPARDFPSQSAGCGNAGDLSPGIDGVAIDGAVKVMRIEQPFSQHFHGGTTTGRGPLFRIEIMVFVAAAFPFEPKLAGFNRIQIVFDLESHVACEP